MPTKGEQNRANSTAPSARSARDQQIASGTRSVTGRNQAAKSEKTERFTPKSKR